MIVQGIDKVYISRREELVFHKDRRWYRFFLENAECQRDDLVAITLGEVGYGTDETRTGTA
jgi:hypothetical protein